MLSRVPLLSLLPSPFHSSSSLRCIRYSHRVHGKQPKTFADSVSVFVVNFPYPAALHMQRTKRLRKPQGRIQPDESESSEKDKASARLCTTITFESDAWQTKRIQRENSIHVIAELKNTKRPALTYRPP